jgi:tetratricopeptide (TPR) repeat protein
VRAREDFLALGSEHAGWANALAGYCEMQLGDYSAARNTFRRAYQLGFREEDFLLNYATALCKGGWTSQSIEIYTEILARHPDHAGALRGRSRAQLNIALRGRRQVSPKALDDAAADVRLNPDSLEALGNAAELFGYAAACDPSNEALRLQGRDYLRRALKLGLTKRMYKLAQSKLQSLHDDEIETLLVHAPEDSGDRFDANPPGQLPQSIEWVALTRPASR